MFTDNMIFADRYDTQYHVFINGGYVTVHKTLRGSKPNGNKTMRFNRQPTSDNWRDNDHKEILQAVDNLQAAIAKVSGFDYKRRTFRRTTREVNR